MTLEVGGDDPPGLLLSLLALLLPNYKISAYDVPTHLSCQAVDVDGIIHANSVKISGIWAKLEFSEGHYAFLVGRDDLFSKEQNV